MGTLMAADIVVSRELKSLQEELSAAQQARAAAPAAPPSHRTAPERRESPDERDMRDQRRELANEVTQFFEEAEKNIASHPAQSVIGAVLVGILIGRLLRPL
jgi:ElaB/YqjD/DUF883 family membrane-anchored ribosome-binding protein